MVLALPGFEDSTEDQVQLGECREDKVQLVYRTEDQVQLGEFPEDKVQLAYSTEDQVQLWGMSRGQGTVGVQY